VQNMIVFRFANAFMEAFWDRNYVESVQNNMAEDFGAQGHGGFCDQPGTIRDVILNHLFQVRSVVRGQFRGYLDEKDVGRGKNTS
jgi:glucose-6-phosphate 1-dehydrogenase